MATGSSSEAADRARSSPELTSRAREEAGIGPKGRAAYCGEDGGNSGSWEDLASANLKKSFRGGRR